MRSGRRFLGSWVAALAVLAGCRDVAPVPAAPDAAEGRASAAARPIARASAAPAATPAAGPRRLKRPVGPVRTLAGRVAIDAGYAAGAAESKVISNNGATVLRLGSLPGGLDAGDALISDAGGDGGAELIGKIRGTTGMTAGAELIGKIRGEGSGLIGKIRYQLAQADAEQRPEIGTILPSAGMAVRVLSLSSGTFLPLGADAAGQPVFEVFSNADGRFAVFLPAEEAGTVLVVARPPGSDDPRLLYQLAASRGDADEAVTEESSRATAFVQLGIARAMFRWVSGAPGLPTDAVALSPAELTAINAGRERLRAAGLAHTAQLPEGERAALAVRLTEIALARIDLPSIMVARATRVGPYEGPEEPAFAALAASLGKYREEATDTMRTIAAQGQDPFAVLSSRPYFTRANEGREVPYTLRKPMDFVDFVVDRFIATDDPLGAMKHPDYADVGRDVGLGDLPSLLRLGAALEGTKAALDRAFYVEDRGIMPALLQAIEAADPAAGKAP